MASETARRQIIREISTISHKTEDVLWELAEAIQRNPAMPAEELDAVVDAARTKMILPVAQFVRRSGRKVN